MSKDIKEYLHFYINAVEYRVRYVDNAPGTWSVWSKLTPGRYARAVEDFSVADIQITPRKLESMTEDEMKAIYKIIFKRDFIGGSIRWIDKEDTSSAKRWVLSRGLDRIGIEMSGQIWADCDLHNYKYNPYFVTHYLLSRGFDLFGLIDAGLALDKEATGKTGDQPTR